MHVRLSKQKRDTFVNLNSSFWPTSPRGLLLWRRGPGLCHFVFYEAGLQSPRQCLVLCSWVTNTMTNHQVPLLLIYFNWCVIYAAVRLTFALLSINKPHSKSQRALKRNANKRYCMVRFALLLYGWPAQCASCWKVICITHLQALIHLFSNRGANLCWKHGCSEENMKVLLIHG